MTISLDSLARLESIVGAGHLLRSAADLERYSQCTIPWDRRCGAVAFPGSIDEVQRLVRLANADRFSIWTFSRGKNWGYGTTCTFETDAIVMILERLNRIEDVDAELGYAVIGPGVSYGELNAHLKAKAIKLWADCTDSTPHGSVIGNALERGQGYTQNGDHFGSLCGLEVVLPDGTLIRTGGGPANSRSFHTYKYGSGPYVEGLFSQSNLGIVVKAGIWLMPEPETFMCFTCEINDPNAYPDVIDSIRKLALAKAITSNVHMVNAFMTIALSMAYPYDRLQGRRFLSEEALAMLSRELALTPWLLSGGLYGPKALVNVSRALITRELSRFGKLTFADDRKVALLERLLSGLRRSHGRPLVHAVLTQLKNWFVSKSPVFVVEALLKFYPVFKGIPGTSSLNLAYAKRRAGRAPDDPDPARDGCGLIWFAPVAPMTGTDTRRVLDLCAPLFKKHELDLSAVFVYLNPRSVMVLMQILFDKENPDETRRAVALYDELAEATLKAGYPQYRTSLAYMDRILKTSDGFYDLVNRLKITMDPQNVLSPGRYGLGPANRATHQ